MLKVVQFYELSPCLRPPIVHHGPSAAEAVHIQSSNTQAHGILEQIQAVNRLENKLFK